METYLFSFYKSYFKKDSYDWFYGPGSHIDLYIDLQHFYTFIITVWKTRYVERATFCQIQILTLIISTLLKMSN